MIVCIGHSVSVRDISRAARQGCNSLTASQQQSRVASVCGAWRKCAGQTFDDACADLTRAAQTPCAASVGIAYPFVPAEQQATNNPSQAPAPRATGQSQWTSDQLPGNSNDIQITHGDSDELLRLTSFGKLILTK